MPANILDTDDDDEEIIEIFVEEAEEVFQELDRQIAKLKKQPTDRAALAEVRRGFHTLKGSGRMAKALELGELAWKIESMLNQVVEGKISASEPMIALVATSHGVMPKLLDAFKHRRKSGMGEDLYQLMDQADAFASGQTPRAAAPRQPATLAGDSAGVQTRLGELQRHFERSARQIDEAIHRAEMALQEARRLGTRMDGIAADLQDRPSTKELNPLVERVNTLSKDILELRQLPQTSQSGTDPKELQQRIDQRVRERMVGNDRAKLDMGRQIEAALEAAGSARRIGVWALSIGLIGAIIAIAALVLI